MKQHSEENATQAFKRLKAQYTKLSITIFITLYKRVHRCSLANHKTIKEYDDEVSYASNKILELGEKISLMQISLAFLDGLDSFYDTWKNMLLSQYSSKSTLETVAFSTLENILVELDYKEARSDAVATPNQTRAFAAQTENKKKSKKRCDGCTSDRHKIDNCYYLHPKKADDKFRSKYSIDESRRSAMKEIKRTNAEWKKNHPRKAFFGKIRATITAEGKKKDNQWYMNSRTFVHVTHDLSLYLSFDPSDLDDQSQWIETTSDEQIATHEAGTINLDITLNSKNTNIHLHNVYFCFELDSNLLFLGALEAKGFEFHDRKGKLEITNDEREIVLVAKRDNNLVYSLQQSNKLYNHHSTEMKAYQLTKSASPEIWHQRADHINYRNLATLSSIADEMAFTLVLNVSISDKNPFCEACTLGKQHKIHSKNPASHRSEIPGERLHSDLFERGGTLLEVGGFHYDAIVVDDATRMKFALTLKTKDEICSQILIIFNKIETHSERKIKFFRTNDEREFRGLVLVLNEKDIQWEKSAFYAQDQNDVFERAIRTILKKARTLLISVNLSRKLWSEALSAACYLSNRSSTKALNDKTSFEAWHEKKLNLSNLRVYECDAYVVDYQAKSKEKMVNQAWFGTLVGYEAKNQWRIFNETHVFIRRDVIFNESKLIYSTSISFSSSSSSYADNNLTDLFPSVRDMQSVGDHAVENDAMAESAALTNSNQKRVHILINDRPGSEQQVGELANQNASASNDSINRLLQEENAAGLKENPADSIEEIEEIVPYLNDVNPLILNEPRTRVRHDYRELNRRDFAKAAKFISHNIVTPIIYEKAISDPQSSQWQQVMKAEYDDQMKRGTFEITALPYDIRAIGGKWVYKLKENSDGSIARYKARWVAQKYRQIEDRDFDETYVLVVRSDTSRILLFIASSLNWNIRQFDIKMAFLYDNMDRMLYIVQSKRFEKRNNVCLLNLALYELVQSAHLWFDEIKDKLLIYGLVQSKHDEALFFNTRKSLYVTVYVDDIKAFAPTNQSINELSTYLQSKYEMTDLDDVKWYLRMKINRTANEAILLTQAKYVRDLLVRHEMKECALVSTSMTDVKLNKPSDDFTCSQNELKQYQILLEELMHLMMQTRLDLAYSVSRLTQFMSNPINEHWIALKRVLRYLNDTKDIGICYEKSLSIMIMKAWTDSSWRDDSDDSRSTHEHLIFMSEEPVSWKSSKQNSVALSSTEAKYVGQATIAINVMWARSLLTKMKIKDAVLNEVTVIYADNQKAIKLANNPIFQKRTKHIAVKYHYIRDLISQKKVELQYQSIKDMIANGLTKSLESILFQKFVSALGLSSLQMMIK